VRIGGEEIDMLDTDRSRAERLDRIERKQYAAPAEQPANRIDIDLVSGEKIARGSATRRVRGVSAASTSSGVISPARSGRR
jgi:hypothetical protein